VELLARAERAAARDDDLRAGQFRTLRLGDLRTDKAGEAGVAFAGDGLDGCAAAFRRRLLERGAADGQHLLGVARLDRRNRVAGINRAGEGVGALDAQHFADLHHVEQRGNARRDVLARGGGRRDERVIARHQLGDQRRDILRQRMTIGRVVREQHLGDAGDLGSSIGRALCALARDQRNDIAQLCCSGDSGERCVLHRRIVMFDPDENAHATTPRILSLPISSSTSATLTPA
jgi:hypothetical protein